MEEKIRESLKTYLGYPCNTSYDYSDITHIFNLHINNIGCPYSSSTYKANTKEIEIDVLNYFADLWSFDKDKIWGYISNGGTEGNLQGLFIGRESLNDPIFYTSEDSHYSIFKIAKILKLNLCIIKTNSNGEMDYNDLENKIVINKDKPILINVNLGTTMKGAIDNPGEIYRIIQKNNMENKYYMHADGALMGFVLPFLEKDIYFKKHIHSISISGHKWLGIPFPCGIFLMEKHFLSFIQNSVEYIGSNDCMISGSRNGHSPVFLKHIITTKTHDDFSKDIDECIKLADYLVSNIKGAWRNHNSITVVFSKPSQDIIDKWQLATSNDISHVVVMQHVNKEKLDKFIYDYNINKLEL